jgi:hypothetical protein
MKKSEKFCVEFYEFVEIVKKLVNHFKHRYEQKTQSQFEYYDKYEIEFIVCYA